MSDTENAWIFQSSPMQYDLPGALTSLKTFTWLVNQYEHEIHAGDRVFLWETGPQAGVLASGRVTSEPTMMIQGQGEEAFERRPDKFSGPRLRVGIEIEHVLRPRLSRQQISADEVLTSLPNLKFAKRTGPRSGQCRSCLKCVPDGNEHLRAARNASLSIGKRWPALTRATIVPSAGM